MHRRRVLGIYAIAFTTPLLHRAAADAADAVGLGAAVAVTWSYAAYVVVGILVWWLASRSRWAPAMPPISPRRPKVLPQGIWNPLLVIVALSVTVATSVVAGPYGKDAEVLSDSAGLGHRLGLRIGAVLVVPVVEELLHRWLLYRGLRPVCTEDLHPLRRFRLVLPAALASSVAYGLFHYMVSSPSRMVVTAVAGLILATSYELSGTLWVPIAVHVFINLQGNLSAEFADGGRIIAMALIVIIALPMFVSLVRIRGEFLNAP